MTRTPLDTVSAFELIADVPGQVLRIKRTMIDISHEIEQTASRASAPCQLFVGFQRLSLFARNTDRYTELSQGWQHCWVFGEADIEPPSVPNVTVVTIPPHSPLTKEWFVIADGPAFGVALLTADVSGFAIADARRRFMGLWSADPQLVRRASTQLATAINLPAPDWTIAAALTLRAYDSMTNNLVALHEERLLSLQPA